MSISSTHGLTGPLGDSRVSARDKLRAATAASLVRFVIGHQIEKGPLNKHLIDNNTTTTVDGERASSNMKSVMSSACAKDKTPGSY